MSTIQTLTSPFKPQREKHALVYCRNFKAINDKRSVSHRDKGILLAILAFTTNDKLFQNFDKLDATQLAELAHLSEIALKNLRNWDGRPSTTIITPVVTPAPSRPSSPQGNPSRKESSSSPGIRGGRLAELQAEEGGLEAIVTPQSCDNPLGRQLLAYLGLGDTFPNIPLMSFSRSAKIGENCLNRQQNFCLITGCVGTHNLAHIFPYSSLNPAKAATILTWRFIHIFLGTENTQLLVDELWSKEQGINTPKNGMSIVTTLHTFFDNGAFSLIPIRLTQGANDYLDVECRLYAPDALLHMTMTRDKANVEEQYEFYEDEAPYRVFGESSRKLNDGDMIRITTPDANIYPLPSPVLLFWHRHLWSTLTSAELVTPQSESKREDQRDIDLRRPIPAQERENSDSQIQKIIENEKRFIEFLHRITTPEDFLDSNGGDYSEDYYYL
ncbi:hypothetical protein AA313_de0210219 [Arthrobotrys entomopaga]|nr:hypothetical protein AA313_de0210219 [Arthrobotrys entomopaga]